MFIQTFLLSTCILLNGILKRVFHFQVQYVFIYDALLDAVICGNTEATAHDIAAKLRYLDQQSHDTADTYLMQEFKVIFVFIVLQGRRSVFLSEGTGNDWQAPIGRGSGVQGIPLKVCKYAFRLRDKPLLSIKVHLILDRIGYLFYDIYQKVGGELQPSSPPAPQLRHAPTPCIVFCFKV